MRDVRLPSLTPPVSVTLLMSWWVWLILSPHTLSNISYTHLWVKSPEFTCIIKGQCDFSVRGIMFRSRKPLHQCESQCQLCSVGESPHPLCLYSFTLFILICILSSLTFAEVQCAVCLVRQKPVLLVSSLPCNYTSFFSLKHNNFLYLTVYELVLVLVTATHSYTQPQVKCSS